MKDYPQFQYLNDTLELEMTYNRFFVKVDSDLYIEVFGEMIPYFSTYNHSNYARCLPFYVRYLMKLKTQHPDLHAEFKKGHFVVTCSLLTDGEGRIT